MIIGQKIVNYFPHNLSVKKFKLGPFCFEIDYKPHSQGNSYVDCMVKKNAQKLSKKRKESSYNIL